MSQASEQPVIVEVQDLARSYQQGEIEVKALRGIDLKIHKGEFTALTGPSGSGKTTALNLIGGLDEATRGEVIINGKKLSSMSASARSELRRDHIGFVFQAYNLIPVLTAYENAETVLRLQGCPAPERKRRVMALLKEVGLDGMEDRLPNQLSGGQQQRVAIARAIVTEPIVTLADEPTANVDSATAEMLLDTMEKLNRERGATFIFSTHDPRVMKRARRIVHMRDGMIESIEDK